MEKQNDEQMPAATCDSSWHTSYLEFSLHLVVLCLLVWPQP